MKRAGLLYLHERSSALVANQGATEIFQGRIFLKSGNEMKEVKKRGSQWGGSGEKWKNTDKRCRTYEGVNHKGGVIRALLYWWASGSRTPLSNGKLQQNNDSKLSM